MAINQQQETTLISLLRQWKNRMSRAQPVTELHMRKHNLDMKHQTEFVMFVSNTC